MCLAGGLPQGHSRTQVYRLLPTSCRRTRDSTEKTHPLLNPLPHTALPLMSIGRNSVTWPHLNTSEPSKYRFAMYPGGKGNGFYWTCSNLCFRICTLLFQNSSVTLDISDKCLWIIHFDVVEKCHMLAIFVLSSIFIWATFFFIVKITHIVSHDIK